MEVNNHKAEIAKHMESFFVNSLSVNPKKWSNTVKQFVRSRRRTVWVCLVILWGWCLKL